MTEEESAFVTCLRRKLEELEAPFLRGSADGSMIGHLKDLITAFHSFNTGNYARARRRYYAMRSDNTGSAKQAYEETKRKPAEAERLAEPPFSPMPAQGIVAVGVVVGGNIFRVVAVSVGGFRREQRRGRVRNAGKRSHKRPRGAIRPGTQRHRKPKRNRTGPGGERILYALIGGTRRQVPPGQTKT
jgi:hypothetical protein